MVQIELVTDRSTQGPATSGATRSACRCFELGPSVICTSLAGSVVEVTPPLTIGDAEVDEALDVLDRALADIEAGRFDDAKLARFAG